VQLRPREGLLVDEAVVLCAAGEAASASERLDRVQVEVAGDNLHELGREAAKRTLLYCLSTLSLRAHVERARTRAEPAHAHAACGVVRVECHLRCFA